MIKNIFTLAMFMVLSNFSMNAQSLVLSLKSGASSTYPISSIRSLKFGATTMSLNEVSGNTTTWNISDIAQYSFSNVTSVVDNANSAENALSIYPLPTNETVNIHYVSAMPTTIKVDIIDALGTVVETLYEGEHMGDQRYTWTTAQQKGVYYCRILSNNKVVTKPIIIQ